MTRNIYLLFCDFLPSFTKDYRQGASLKPMWKDINYWREH